MEKRDRRRNEIRVIFDGLSLCSLSLFFFLPPHLSLFFSLPLSSCFIESQWSFLCSILSELFTTSPSMISTDRPSPFFSTYCSCLFKSLWVDGEYSFLKEEVAVAKSERKVYEGKRTEKKKNKRQQEEDEEEETNQTKK